MDCRWCDWYLCRACLPVYRAKASSIWGMLMSLPAYAADKMLTDPLPAGSPETSRAASHGRNSRLVGSTPQEQAACALISEFCEASPSSSVCSHVPTERELQSLWMKCSMLPPWPVAEAICEQLSWVADFMWPPKLRAIHAIDYISKKGEEAIELIDLISERAGPLLSQIIHIPQLKAKTMEVMQNLRANAAFSSFSTTKSDEESCALRMQARADTKDGNMGNSNVGLSQRPTLADLFGLPLPQRQLSSRCEQDWLSQLRFLDGVFCFEPCQQEPSLVKTLRIAGPLPVDVNKEPFTLQIASPTPIRL